MTSFRKTHSNNHLNTSFADMDLSTKNLYDKIELRDADGGPWTQWWRVRYKGGEWDGEKLKVFVVLHSHNDPGWKLTVDEYYKRQIEESESGNLFHDHIQGEDENAEDVRMADHLRPMEELLRIPILGIEDAIVVLAVLADQFELTPELLDFVSVLPSDTETYPREERKAVTIMSGLTLNGYFIPHSNFLIYQDEELEPETITEVVEIASSKSTPLVPSPETPPLSVPKPKEDFKPNPHQPLIPCSSQLQEEKFHALENLTERADHFVYKIDIVDSLCDKFPIENNSLSGNPTPSSRSMVESLSPLPTPFGDSDSLLEETDTLLSHSDDSL
ncbi:reverse transcriptase domain-containing protein, partial [Tanacetum coccineum]